MQNRFWAIWGFGKENLCWFSLESAGISNGFVVALIGSITGFLPKTVKQKIVSAASMPEFFDWKEIIKKIEEWITGHTDDDKDPNLVPVLLVPGIGASILNAVCDKSKERVWVRLFAADREFKKRLWSRYDPATGKTVSLDPDSHIEVPDDNYGLYSCDILDPAVIIRLNVVYNFHDLIKQMLKWGYSEGTTLFGYGYDFRQSNRLPEAVDGLRIRLESIHKSSGGKKVNIISHSMGGLLVKSFLALQPNAFETLVNSWTTISTPFQGAPGYITDCLLTGVEFLKGWQKELWVSKWSTHQLLVECPSVYEMMASLTHEWQRTPQLRIWKKKANGNSGCHAELHSYGPLASVSVIEAALKDNTLSYDGKTIPIPFNRSILEWSNESRRLWLSAKLPEGFKFYNIYGTTNDTAFDVCYGSEEKPISELKEILHTEAEFVCVDGDGTVPSESSMADGFTATARYGVPGSHRGLLRSERLFELLKDILEIKKDKASLTATTPPERPEQVIHKVEHICLHINHENWDTVSEDSQDYNLLNEDETVAAIQMENARAEAHATASVHDPHPGFSTEHVKVSIIGVSEGTDKELMNRVLEQAIASALDKFKACNIHDS